IVLRTTKNLLLMLMLVMLIIGGLVSCSSNSNSNEDEQIEGNSSANGEISGELEIQYFVGGYGDAWWKNIIEEFEEKYPDVKVIEQAGSNINEEMKTRWISGNPPDFVYLGGEGMNEATMIEDGLLMDLTDWVKNVELDDGEFLMDSFLVPPHEYDDKVYSIPYIFDTWGVWYDKDWFDKKDFEVPTDFDSWMDSMEEIKDEEGISPFTTTGMYPYYFLNGVLHSG